MRALFWPHWNSQTGALSVLPPNEEPKLALYSTVVNWKTSHNPDSKRGGRGCHWHESDHSPGRCYCHSSHHRRPTWQLASIISQERLRALAQSNCFLRDKAVVTAPCTPVHSERSGPQRQIRSRSRSRFLAPRAVSSTACAPVNTSRHKHTHTHREIHIIKGERVVLLTLQGKVAVVRNSCRGPSLLKCIMQKHLKNDKICLLHPVMLLCTLNVAPL